ANAGATLSAVPASLTQPANGTVTLNANGSFTYTPNTGFAGADTFSYKISDGVNTSAPAPVTVLVGRQVGLRVDDGTAQRSQVRSLSVVFNGTPTFAGAQAAAFTLTITGGAAVPFVVNMSSTGGLTTATFTFTGAAIINGSLADNNYTLTALANQITIGGQAL